MKASTRMMLLLAGACASLPSGLPAAGNWFGGVELGWARVTFQPYYTVPATGEAPARYFDRGSGVEAGVVFGREWRVKPGFALGAQLRAALVTARWEADFTVGESSHIRYDLDSTVALGIVPALRIRPGVWLAGEAGWGMARVREVKTSVDFTRYDFDKWVGCLVVGGGVRWKVTRSVELTVNYRFRKTLAFTYRSFLPNGAPWETITDKPGAHAVTGGVRLRLGR